MTSVTFFGEQFELAEDGVSEFTMMEFAEAASNGVDADVMEGLAALMRVLREVIAEQDWARFRAAARKGRAKSADLVPLIQAAFEAAAERPTGEPSGSSVGPVSIEPKSDTSGVASVTQAFPGRTDLQLMALQTQEYERSESA